MIYTKMLKACIHDAVLNRKNAKIDSPNPKEAELIHDFEIAAYNFLKQHPETEPCTLADLIPDCGMIHEWYECHTQLFMLDKLHSIMMREPCHD